jgi:3-phosphoshikimate 1-carboxyvinyltransferase
VNAGLTLRLRGGHPLQGRVHTPGDKSISHRALILGSLAEGTTVVRGLSDGADVAHTLGALRLLGAEILEQGDGVVTVTGNREALSTAAGPLDCGNSGTGMRLLAGVVAGLPGKSVLVGDESLSARPMDRIAAPLAALGARVEGQGERCRPPLTVAGGSLRGIDWVSPLASAQVKSCVLLAAQFASGPTTFHEPARTRTHTEEMLLDCGSNLVSEFEGVGRVVRLEPGPLRAHDWSVPGDPSQAAFWIVGACVVPGSDIVVDSLYAGAERIGFLGVLHRMGASVEITGSRSTADVHAAFSTLRATEIHAEEIPSLDEVPALAVAAACAEGTTRFVGMDELRVKEVDRLVATAAMVVAFGARASIEGDDLIIEGAGSAGLRPGTFASQGDHRMAMAAALCALAAEGWSFIEDFDAVDTSYPGFLGDLVALAGTEAVETVEGAAAVAGSAAVERAAVPSRRGLLVAIDGPAGSGKSTVSRAVAERLGLERLDTGAMYRAVAWAALDREVDLEDVAALAAIAGDAVLELEDERVVIDGHDVTEAIRSPEVGHAVSLVASVPEVRRLLVERQRRWVARHGAGVVEGRDIGSVVFPDADVKVFLTAALEERARRRQEESEDQVARRDRIDSTRLTSPLTVAEGAHVLDTTGRSVDDVVEEVLSWL